MTSYAHMLRLEDGKSQEDSLILKELELIFIFNPINSFRFFIQIASDCESLDNVTSMSFISDANVLALHRLLWNHQEKIGDYLSSSRDHKAVGRRPFDKMATLLAYLGPPEHKNEPG